MAIIYDDVSRPFTGAVRIDQMDPVKAYLMAIILEHVKGGRYPSGYEAEDQTREIHAAQVENVEINHSTGQVTIYLAETDGKCVYIVLSKGEWEKVCDPIAE